MNKPAVKKIRWIINTMTVEAAKKDAPVNRVHDITMGDPFRSLIFTILSSRTKDETTLKAVTRLLEEDPNPYELAGKRVSDIEKMIYGVGFYRVKAKNLKKMARMLVVEYKGIVPERMEELVKLPGVGRKTANIMLAYVFNTDAIAVDIHVHRISNRLGIVKSKKPEDTEQKLMKVVPKSLWRRINHAFVAYGQTVCIPRRPNCEACKVRNLCKRVGVK